MELLPVVDVRDRNVVTVFGVHDAPVWWRAHLVDSVDGILVQSAIAGPCDTLVGHGVIDRGIIVTAVQQAWGNEAVVEKRVCDQTARIVGLARIVESKRVAVAVADGVIINKVALELVGAERLDVATVVLIEVCELVVEEHGGGQVVRNPEAQLAYGSVNRDSAVMVGDLLVEGSPLRSLRGSGGVLEMARNEVRGDGGEFVCGIECAALVFDRQLLDLRARPQQQSS